VPPNTLETGCLKIPGLRGEEERTVVPYHQCLLLLCCKLPALGRGFGRDQGREDAGRAGAAVRCPPQSRRRSSTSSGVVGMAFGEDLRQFRVNAALVVAFVLDDLALDNSICFDNQRRGGIWRARFAQPLKKKTRPKAGRRPGGAALRGAWDRQEPHSERAAHSA
jgi:hypothetical protein